MGRGKAEMMVVPLRDFLGIVVPNSRVKKAFFRKFPRFSIPDLWPVPNQVKIASLQSKTPLSMAGQQG